MEPPVGFRATPTDTADRPTYWFYGRRSRKECCCWIQLSGFGSPRYWDSAASASCLRQRQYCRTSSRVRLARLHRSGACCNWGLDLAVEGRDGPRRDRQSWDSSLYPVLGDVRGTAPDRYHCSRRSRNAVQVASPGSGPSSGCDEPVLNAGRRRRTTRCRHHRNGVGLRGGWRSGVVLTLLPLLSAPCLKSSGEEDVYGPIRWTGRARGDVYVGGGGTIGPAPDVEGCRDERSSSGGSNPKYPGSGASLLGGRNAERVAARDPRAGGVGDRGRVAAGDEGSEGRPSRRLVAGGGAAGGSDPHAGVQGAEALGGIAKRGDDVPDGHPGRGEGEEPPEGGLAWTRDPGRRWGLRREEAREVAEGAADVGASTDGGVAGTGARPTGSAAR